MDVALRLLGRREYSQAELRAKLLQRYRQKFSTSGNQSTSGDDTFIDSPAEAPPDAETLIGEVLAELVNLDLQSDERFAGSLVRRKLRAGYGPPVVRRELQAKGISGQLLDEIMRLLASAGSNAEDRLDRPNFDDPVSNPVDVGQPPDWQEVVGDIVSRRYPRAQEDARVWARAMRYCQRRGLPGDAVRAVLGRQPFQSRSEVSD